MDIQIVQRCEPGCARNLKVIAELKDIIGFGTLGESGGLFITDGDKRVCLNETCPACDQSITYVTNIKKGGQKNGF